MIFDIWLFSLFKRKSKSLSLFKTYFLQSSISSLEVGLWVVATTPDMEVSIQLIYHQSFAPTAPTTTRTGASGAFLMSWFPSYLTNRTFVMFNDNIASKVSPLLHGVPQGAVLGPVLFLLCIHPHGHITVKHFYADDIQLYFSFNESKLYKIAHLLNSFYSICKPTKVTFSLLILYIV